MNAGVLVAETGYNPAELKVTSDPMMVLVQMWVGLGTLAPVN